MKENNKIIRLHILNKLDNTSVIITVNSGANKLHYHPRYDAGLRNLWYALKSY